MRKIVRSIGSILPFVIVIIVVGWFIYTRPPPTDIQETNSVNSKPEALAEPNDVIFECRSAIQRELRSIDTLGNITNKETNSNAELLSFCDKQMIFYRDECQANSSKSYCTNPGIDGYFFLRKS